MGAVKSLNRCSDSSGETLIAALFTSPGGFMVSHFPYGPENNSTRSLTATWGRGRRGILVPMKHDELRKECSLP